jgi:hypothetical protein
MEVAERGGNSHNGGTGAASIRIFKRADRLCTQLRPELVAYEFLFELQPVNS